jgi:hypothetical protein
MADAGAIDLIEHMQRGIGLHGIERVAGKGIDESLRRDAEFLRKDHIERIERFQLLDDPLDIGEAGKRVGVLRRHVHGATWKTSRRVLGPRGRGVKRRRSDLFHLSPIGREVEDAQASEGEWVRVQGQTFREQRTA